MPGSLALARLLPAAALLDRRLLVDAVIAVGDVLAEVGLGLARRALLRAPTVRVPALGLLGHGQSIPEAGNR